MSGDRTIELLSREWLAAFADRLANAPPVHATKRLSLGQVVTGGPEGELSWTLLVGGGLPAGLVEGTEEAEVILVEDYETARQIASDGSTADLLAAGRLKIRGDSSALVEARDTLARLAEVLGELEAGGATTR